MHWELRCNLERVQLQPIWSWDNARIHGSVANGGWADLEITAADHTGLPPYSPDMHSVIELCHALVMGHVQRFINRTVPQSGHTLEMYTSHLFRLFHSIITPTWAQNTTHRLFTDVLPGILEAEGHYAPKRQR